MLTAVELIKKSAALKIFRALTRLIMDPVLTLIARYKMQFYFRAKVETL